jgi:hypothetical protein
MLAINVGTYCDGCFMDTYIAALAGVHDITLMTGRSHSAASPTACSASAFCTDLPISILDDASAAPTHFLNGMHAAGDCPLSLARVHAGAVARFPRMVAWHVRLLAAVLGTVTTEAFDCIVAHAAALPVLITIMHRFGIGFLPPVVVIYYIPMLDSSWYSFAYHDVHKRRGPRHGRQQPRHHFSTLLRAAAFPCIAKPLVVKYLRAMRHVDATSPIMRMPPAGSAEDGLPSRVARPEDFLSMRLPHYTVIGMALTHPTTPAQRTAAAHVLRSLPRDRPFVFVTLGSYASHVAGHFARSTWLGAWGIYARRSGCEVLLHGCGEAAAQSLPARVHVTAVFMDYETVVRDARCASVFFTGSVGLQNICWAARRPMCFLPHLAEQFFSARVYEAYCGTRPIDCAAVAATSPTAAQLAAHLLTCVTDSGRVARLHERVCRIAMAEAGREADPDTDDADSDVDADLTTLRTSFARTLREAVDKQLPGPARKPSTAMVTAWLCVVVFMVAWVVRGSFAGRSARSG